MLSNERANNICFPYANKPSFSGAVGKEEEEASEPELEAELKMFGEEQKQMGKLSWAVYRSYWRAVGGCMALAVLLSLFLMQGSNTCISVSSAVCIIKYYCKTITSPQ